ncbi:proteophosphoglycan 5 [Streptomyces sp. NPDC017260]|uniref:proteophosphoglycan 5 n=1 Tax=unclassified Streptomyces TaxID=2593676 RepID=UPI0037892AA8
MALVTVDLAAPQSMRGRWAAWAAVGRATGGGKRCYAKGPVWHYDDGGGNWIDLHHLGDGRAVLTGNDHACSPDPDDEDFDPMDGAPWWWEDPVREAVRANENVAVVYGFDGTVWQRVASDVDDGFSAIGLPALPLARTRERIADACRYDPATGLFDPTRPAPSDETIDALIAADADVTEELVAAVVGAKAGDPAAGAAHARAFLTA